MAQELAGRVAIITGGGRGIGRAVAEALCAEGAKAMIGTRTLKHGEDAVAALQRAGHEAAVIQTEAARREDIRRLVDETVKRYGRVDIVVHCAADHPFTPIAELTEEGLERTFASIMKAAIWLTQDAGPHLARAGGGRIIFISSLAGSRQAMPHLAHYCAAKAGLEAFARSAAVELAPQGTTVNCVAPGVIDSARSNEAMPAGVVAQFTADQPVPRAGTNEEVAHAVRFLASPLSGYMTGTSVVVDGGRSLCVFDVTKAGH